jgi:hypothetical protein
MAKSKAIKVGSRDVMVRELIMQEIYDIVQAEGRPPLDEICDILDKCTDTTREELMGCAPSDLGPLIDTLLEVNQAFFDLATRLEMNRLVASFQQKLQSVSMLAYLPLSPPATA